MGTIPGREDNLMYRLNDGYNLDKKKTNSSINTTTYSMPSLFTGTTGNSLGIERSVSNALSILNGNHLSRQKSTYTLEEKILNDFYKPIIHLNGKYND